MHYTIAVYLEIIAAQVEVLTVGASTSTYVVCLLGLGIVVKLVFIWIVINVKKITEDINAVACR